MSRYARAEKTPSIVERCCYSSGGEEAIVSVPLSCCKNNAGSDHLSRVPFYIKVGVPRNYASYRMTRL